MPNAADLNIWPMIRQHNIGDKTWFMASKAGWTVLHSPFVSMSRELFKMTKKQTGTRIDILRNTNDAATLTKL
jgi:hypothetical protein